MPDVLRALTYEQRVAVLYVVESTAEALFSAILPECLVVEAVEAFAEMAAEVFDEAIAA